MRLRPRSCIFWNGINRDIEVVVRKCATCKEVQRAKPREPLMSHETHARAWQIVGTELFLINRETCILVSDYYSKFPFVYMIPSPHRRSQDFCLGGGVGTRPTSPRLTSVVHTFEAVAGSRGSVSAPAVSRVMGGSPERNKNRKKI